MRSFALRRSLQRATLTLLALAASSPAWAVGPVVARQAVRAAAMTQQTVSAAEFARKTAADVGGKGAPAVQTLSPATVSAALSLPAATRNAALGQVSQLIGLPLNDPSGNYHTLSFDTDGSIKLVVTSPTAYAWENRITWQASDASILVYSNQAVPGQLGIVFQCHSGPCVHTIYHHMGADGVTPIDQAQPMRDKLGAFTVQVPPATVQDFGKTLGKAYDVVVQGH